MKITVFTPTYNRAFIIERLYKSLQRQSFTDFEWLVIDDGSSDNTMELFDAWKLESNAFPISYIKTNNGGKHRAINRATELAAGQLFFIVDSDDYLTDDALEIIDKWEGSLDHKTRFAGVAGRKGYDGDSYIGTTFAGEFVDATSLERDKYNIDGDKAEVFYTHILKQYKFQEFEGENFITENTVWERLAADGYKLRWFNETIYICEYLEDGLSKNAMKNYVNNPQGSASYIKHQLLYKNKNLRWKMSNYSFFYESIKDQVSMRKASLYLGISPFFLASIVFIVKVKQLITSSLRNVRKYES